uniref:Piezo-type mechanosensitive ion channel component 2 n=1 Tax=Anthurium amnicola TaxID=1678845 RepID=A0A1D1YZ96_9ARAE
MGWSEMEGRCRRHPKHRQSKGVCPSCLRERLSQISTSSTNTSSSLSSPTSSYDSISSSSSYLGSPSTGLRPRGARAKIAHLVKQNGREHPLLGKPAEALTKSRSLAFVISNPLGGGKKDKKEKQKMEEEEEKSKSEGDGDKVDHVEEGRDENTKKKKRGFWSLLAVGGKKRKDKDAIFHSRTVRETSSARWAFLP